MSPNSYIIVWADKDTLDVGIHANFKLAATGESVYFSNASGNLIDEITFGSQTDGTITFGRIPNGTGPWVYVNASFNSINLFAAGIEDPEVVVPQEKDFTIYPNPTSSNLNILVNQVGPYQINIRDINGREVVSTNMDSSSDTHTINITPFAAGFYIITLTHNDFISTKKFIIN
jgi:hypothetical protein